MMKRMMILVTLAALAGCQEAKDMEKGRVKEPADQVALEAGKKLLLSSEPAGAKSVTEVRKSAKDGDEVVVAAQVGGAHAPFVQGRASVTVVDASFTPGECECPWDFCDTDKNELKAGRALVKFVDAGGNTLAAGAKELFGIKELSKVVVKGKASRDDKGNLTILATGLYVRKGGQ